MLQISINVKKGMERKECQNEMMVMNAFSQIIQVGLSHILDNSKQFQTVGKNKLDESRRAADKHDSV